MVREIWPANPSSVGAKLNFNLKHTVAWLGSVGSNPTLPNLRVGSPIGERQSHAASS